MSRTRRFALAAAALLAAMALAGCGGGSQAAASSQTAASAPAGDSAAGGQGGDDNGPETAAAVTGADAAGPTSEHFKLGTNYIRLSPTQPTSSSPTEVEVAEVFWYGCPHCYHFEDNLKRWLAKKPSYVHFIRIPAVWNPLLRLHARAFYTAQILGKGDAMHAAFFNEIHVAHNELDTEDKLAAFFGRFGVDAATFKKTFESYAVQEKMQRADELNRRYRIEAVPSMVVNGKYMTNGNMVGSYDDMLALVDELVASEKAAQQ